MKRLILFSMVCFIATVTQAQNDSIKTETLQEVTVQGSKVVQRVDGQTIYPTRQQLESSTNGYPISVVYKYASTIWWLQRRTCFHLT